MANNNKLNSIFEKIADKNEIILFSIIILAYNEEKNIGTLLNTLGHYSRKYNIETIIIDSGSTDSTTQIVLEKMNNIQNIRLFSVRKSEFNFATTRNEAIKLARGQYIYFISGDAIPIDKDFLSKTLMDFKLDNRCVCVYGAMIAKNNCNTYFLLEQMCFYKRINKYINKEGLLITDNKNIFNDKDKFIHYFISNVFVCYLKDFLIKNPFIDTQIGSEDVVMGKSIIAKGFVKLYDSNLVAIHSHNYSLKKYYWMQKRDIYIKKNFTEVGLSSNFMCKYNELLRMNIPPSQKFLLGLQLVLYYLLKLCAFVDVKVRGLSI